MSRVIAGEKVTKRHQEEDKRKKGRKEKVEKKRKK